MATSQLQHAGIRLVRPANSHNDAMQRIYKNWTPEDLTVLERQPEHARPFIVRMVRDDYLQVIYTTSRLLLYGVARYVRRNLPKRRTQ